MARLSRARQEGRQDHSGQSTSHKARRCNFRPVSPLSSLLSPLCSPLSHLLSSLLSLLSSLSSISSMFQNKPLLKALEFNGWNYIMMNSFYVLPISPFAPTLKLKPDELLSNFPYNFFSRRYSKATEQEIKVEATGSGSPHERQWRPASAEPTGSGSSRGASSDTFPQSRGHSPDASNVGGWKQVTTAMDFELSVEAGSCTLCTVCS